ncbi:zinc ribbon domain-containing protein [Advenella sp. WQ 585]|uniref:Zinc ribbon domain-containing protein n=1 Tax=Advenella mandrilli TaxID=2800330 RepID=A0ABS1EAY3_9BURK|nr:zinc ribbon domain-containing protein [Advenella mandrilli]MBK1781024.1 zinc ribbon domain-containing protein [Advenella mandrilli]
MAKFCMKCGTALHEGAKFCMKCGHALPGIAQTAPAQIRCERCGESLKTGMKFCPKCGARVGQALTVDIPVSEPVVSVEVSDLPPNVEAAQKEHPTENGEEKATEKAPAVKKEAAHLAKKALSALLDQTVSASDKAGEMRISISEAQKSLLTHVIRELAKRIVK